MADQPTRIRRVELRSADVEASAGFYARLVGLEPAAIDHRRAELRAPGREEPLLVLHRAERPGPAPRAATGLFHVAFRYAERAGLAAALARLATGDSGPGLGGAADHGVSEALYLDDPDGIGIELYRDRPREQWPAAEGSDRVRMFTEPLDLGDLARSAGREGTGNEAAAVGIGHVHLKVADVAAAERFWTERIGMRLMTRFGPDASFLAYDDYHHHVGVNSWYSRGADREPRSGPGLEAIALRSEPGVEAAETPDGIPILAEPGGGS